MIARTPAPACLLATATPTGATASQSTQQDSAKKALIQFEYCSMLLTEVIDELA
jgi:hypothetical protein